MIFYIQEFDRKPEISDAQMREIYKRMAEGWERAWPTNKLVGFFVRRYALGAGTQYMAIWEMPDFAAFDEWRGTWDQVKSFMQSIEDEYHASYLNMRSGIVERLMP